MSSRLRIAFIGMFGNSSVNGVENAGFYLAQELASQPVDVFFYYISCKTGQLTDGNQIHHRFFMRSRFSFWLPKDFGHLLENNPDRIDVFHLHSVFIPYHFFISLILNRNKMPYVVTPHGGYIRKALERTLQTHRFVKSMYIYFVERYIVKHAKAMIAMTDFEAEDIRSFGYNGSVHVLPNLNPPLKEDLEFVPSQNFQTILFLGRYDIAHKGLFFLLDTFRVLTETLPHVQLVFHGNGKDKLLLEKKVREEKIPRVMIGDPVYGSEKVHALQNCTLYCQPSNYEAFSLSIVEAMLAGKAVALTEGCYLSAMFRRHELGLILPSDARSAARKIKDFLSNSEELVRHGKALRALALREFDSTLVRNRTLDIYRSVLDRNLPVAPLTSSLS